MNLYKPKNATPRCFSRLPVDHPLYCVPHHCTPAPAPLRLNNPLDSASLGKGAALTSASLRDTTPSVGSPLTFIPPACSREGLTRYFVLPLQDNLHCIKRTLHWSVILYQVDVHR